MPADAVGFTVIFSTSLVWSQWDTATLPGSGVSGPDRHGDEANDWRGRPVYVIQGGMPPSRALTRSSALCGSKVSILSYVGFHGQVFAIARSQPG